MIHGDTTNNCKNIKNRFHKGFFKLSLMKKSGTVQLYYSIINCFSMNIKRAIGFALSLYVVLFVGFLVTFLLPGEQSLTEVPPLATFVIVWLMSIPAVLLLAKWYFRKVSATKKNGFLLGIVTIVVSLLIDGLFIAGTIAAGESVETVKVLYTDWKFYATVLEIILLTTYAGYEFDSTYTETNV